VTVSLSKLKSRANALIGRELTWHDAPHGWHSLAYDGDDVISLDPFKLPHIARVNGRTIPLDVPEREPEAVQMELEF